ncbi:MAG: dihydroorotase [Dehalococcoidia bacterium]|nr:dihydroorotase [Dehalococcoidia bacterium]
MIHYAQTSLLIRAGRLLDPGQSLDCEADLLMDGGRITAIGRPGSLQGEDVFPAEGLVVAPGFIDLHCHLREPGFEEKETIATGTAAAAAGGFTTVCCMPNTNPAMDRASVVEHVQKMARVEGRVRVLPVGCVTRGRKGEQLAELAELAQAGVMGFSDDGSPVANARLMRSALEYCTMLGLPVIDHCQEPSLSHGAVMHEGWVSTALGLKGEPSESEEIMVERDIALAKLTGGWAHIAHVSTAGAVEQIRRAKARGIRVTAEVAPHHLTMTHEWVAGRAALPGIESWPDGTLAPYDASTKVNPPLRTAEDVQALVGGLLDGTIDAIATDHAPHDQPSKLCEYDNAAFGISGLETALGLLMTLVHSGQMELSLVISKLTSGPASIILGAGSTEQEARPSLASHSPLLAPGAGSLLVGAPADIAIFDPERTWIVDPGRFASKGKNTPLAGITLKGRVVATVYNGSVVYRG